MRQSVPENLQTRPFEGCRDLPIKRQILLLQRNYKNEYVQPEIIPYRERMARQHYGKEEGTIEDIERKKMQADISRISRHRTRFVENRISEDIPNLRRVLHQRIKRMVEMEDFVNSWFSREGLSPVNFDEMCDDDDEESNSPNEMWNNDRDSNSLNKIDEHQRNNSNDRYGGNAHEEYDDESSGSENELIIVEEDDMEEDENSSN